MDTLQLHPVPAWSQPAGGPYREPPRNDPPRGDLADRPSPVGRPVLITEMVAERVIETVIVETRPRGGA